MKPERIAIAGLNEDVDEGAVCVIAGRLVQVSPATLTIEDQSDRRTFGFPNQNPDLARVRVGDIVELFMRYENKAWRVGEAPKVLVPCLLEGAAQQRWMRRFFNQGDQKRRNLTLRSRLKRAMHDFFAHEDFLEMDTPLLVACPGMEPNLVGFSTEWVGPDRDWCKRYYMPTSPEFHMKKLLTMGYERIYEFSRSFRNGEYSGHHQPEFTMLEWYRAYAGYEQIMEDIEALVFYAVREATGKNHLEYRGHPIDLKPPWERVSVRELFLSRFRIDLNTIHSGADLATAAIANGFTYVRPDESLDDVFFRLFLTEIELKLGWEKPVILYDYPIEMAALSRRKDSNPRYCERFEVYMAGVELANAFGELNQAAEQAKRFKAFSDESQAQRGFHYEQDREFMQALRFGMPPSAGIALGFDRLVMLAANENALDAVLAFPHLAPVEEDVDS